MKITWLAIFVMLVALTLRVGYWFVGVDRPLTPCMHTQSAQMIVVVEEVSLRRDLLPRVVLKARIERPLACAPAAGKWVRLNWYRPSHAVQEGDVLEVQAKLKRPWGSLNEGGFNYRLWLLGQNIVATGYLVSTPSWRSPPRQTAVNKTETAESKTRLVSSLNQGLIDALALGKKSGVTPEDWKLFRDTGTIHLMVVSGLHVGILGGLIAFALGLVSLPWSRYYDYIPRHFFIAATAAGLVLGYAWLTGSHPPVVRAAVLFCAVAMALVSKRATNPLIMLLLIAVVTLFVFPNQLLKQGFWLSYGAVAALVYYFYHQQRQLSWVAAFCSCQLVLFFALLPGVGFVVGPAAVLGPLANLLVVPLVTSLTIPAAMLHVLLVNVGLELLAQVANHVVGLTMTMVKTVLQTFPAVSAGFLTPMQLAATLGLFPMLVAPIPRQVRVLTLLAWLIGFMHVSNHLPPGEFQIRTLDVGQGSAAILTTRTKRLLVDVGPKFGASFDAGRDIVIPTLRQIGKQGTPTILITHHDSDHAGGLAAVVAEYPESPQYSPEHACISGTRWVWDQVEFTLLRQASANNRNDGSCTLLIRGYTSHAYFAGDIGRRAELGLLSNLPRKIDFLSVPHHGSRSSSHPAFVAKLRPRWAVVSAGRSNRYGHPNSEIVDRYEAQQAQVITTADYGQLTWSSRNNQIYGQRRQLAKLYLPIRQKIGRRDAGRPDE